MLSESELLRAIDELEDSAPTFQNCQKMATFYTLLNSMYRSGEKIGVQKIETEHEEVIGNHGDSEFLRMIDGMDSREAWMIIDELMDAIQVLQPRLYDSVMRRLRGEA